MEPLPTFRSCFVCGTDNPSGMKIRYHLDPATGEVAGNVESGPDLCGYPSILHGGIQAALLDDVMYWAVAHRHGTSCATLELQCSYRNRATLGQTFRLTATAGEADGRKATARGRVTDAAGTEVAAGTGLYLLHPPEQFRAQALPHMEFEGCSPEMVARFRAQDLGPQQR